MVQLNFLKLVTPNVPLVPSQKPTEPYYKLMELKDLTAPLDWTLYDLECLLWGVYLVKKLD